MKSKQEVADDFGKNVMKFLTTNNIQRQEMYSAYEYKDGHQWTDESISERQRKDKAVTTVNLCASYVRAVAGSDVLKANQLDFISMDENFDQEADIMDDSIEYAQYASSYFSERGLARTDTLTCGIGATVTYLDMTHKNFIAGKPIVERIFPGFVFFDNSSRGSQINKKARWCVYADPVSRDTMTSFIESEKGTEVGAPDFKAFLMSFSQQQNTADIEFIYHYFWWEFDDIYDVANPFVDQQNPLSQILAEDNAVANMFGELMDKTQLDGSASYWSLDKESFDALNVVIENIQGFYPDEDVQKAEYSKRKGKCYYRAQFARGMIVKSSRSYTQGVHAMNIMTGYFDEIMGVYYGLMRPLSQIQDALNISISDFQTYTKRVSTGGNAYIAGAGESLERLKNAKANEDPFTPIPKDAVITAKDMGGAAPQVLIEFSKLMIDLMPRTLGLPPEFMGMITSGDMTDSLFGRVMKQTFNVLEDFANNSASADIDQGTIFVDLIRLMAEANDGQILPVLSPNKKPENYIRLRKQSLAMEYAIRIVERPMTKDEKQAQFNALAQLVPQFQQAGVNVMPVLAKLSGLEQELKDELVHLSTPQPAPPDPLNENLLKSQADLQGAQAKKLAAEAQEIVNNMAATLDKLHSEVDKNNAQALVYMEQAKPDSAPLIDKMKIDMAHKAEIAAIESKERIALGQMDASAKPPVNMNFDANNVLGDVAGHLGNAAKAMQDMSAHTMNTNDAMLQVHRDTADAHRMSAGEMAKAAKSMRAPKKTEFTFNKAGRPSGAIQTHIDESAHDA